LILDKIEIADQWRRSPSGGANEVEGLDTETKNGYARVGADSRGSFELNDIDDVFMFLTNRRHSGKTNLFYNLRFDFMAVFKHEIDIFSQLMDGETARYGKYVIELIPGKMLTIRNLDGKRTYNFYDLAQFFNIPLADASRKYLGREPHKLKCKRQNLFDSYNLREIGEYCRDDAEITKELGEWFFEKLAKLGMYPKKMISPGYLSARYCLRKGNLPVFDNLPYDMQRAYWQGYRGGWFDCY